MKNFILILTTIPFLMFGQIDCTTFDDWPISDPLGGPNQNSWCEWCTDYANNPGQPFNPIGINWGDPNIMCDCCDPALIINEEKIKKEVLKITNLLGQESISIKKGIIIYIYNDGSIEKVFIKE